MKGLSIVLAGFITGTLLITSSFRPAHALPASDPLPRFLPKLKP